MTARIVKINKLIQRSLGEIIQQELDLPVDVLVTISQVETTPNLRSAIIWLYVFPLQQGDKILELIHSDIYNLQGKLNRRLNMRPLPRISFRIDYGSEQAETVERSFNRLEREE